MRAVYLAIGEGFIPNVHKLTCEKAHFMEIHSFSCHDSKENNINRCIKHPFEWSIMTYLSDNNLTITKSINCETETLNMLHVHHLAEKEMCLKLSCYELLNITQN